MKRGPRWPRHWNCGRRSARWLVGARRISSIPIPDLRRSPTRQCSLASPSRVPRRMTATRRRAAIMVADVAGLSSVMGADKDNHADDRKMEALPAIVGGRAGGFPGWVNECFAGGRQSCGIERAKITYELAPDLGY